jgi:hypothetical protein
MKEDDANRLKVNGRLLLDDEYYSVAVPEGFAQAQKLVYNEDRYIDLVEEVHRELLRLGRSPSDLPQAPARRPLPDIVGVPPAPLQAAALAAPLQENVAAPQPQPAEPIVPKNRLESHPIWFFSMPPPSFQFNSQALKSMDGASLGTVKDQFSKIPIAGSKVTNKDSFAVKSHIELGVDLRQFDIMARSDFDFGVDRFPGIEQPGISPNQMLIGGIGRWKLPAAKIPIALLGGFFLDGNPFHPPNDQFTGTMTKCEKPAPLSPSDIKGGCSELDPALVTSYPQGRTITTNGPLVTVVTRKGDYRFLGLGTETIRTLQPFSRVTVGQLSFRYDIGTNHTSREGLSVAGTTFTMDDYVNKGVQALVSQVLQSNSAVLGSTDQRVEFEYRQRPQKRLNVASQVDLQIHKDKYEHDLKFTITPKYQWWHSAFEPALSPRWNLDLKAQMNLPVPKFPRFAFIPYWERQWVKANGIDSPFVLERYGIEVQLPLSVKLGNGRLWY